MMGSSPKPHAILVCYSLQGHAKLIPTIHLAIKLAQKNSNIDIFISVQGHQDLDIRYMMVSDGLPVNFDRSLNHDHSWLLYYMSLQIEKPFYTIGPIFPPEFTKSSVTTSMWFESDCTHWLDLQQHATVLYVSFAYGLSLSKVRFIWVLRPDIVSSYDPNPLSKDFEGEICGRGFVVPWCCQKQIPLLYFPLLTDQFTNQKFAVDDWKIELNLCDKNPITKVEISEKIHNFMYGKLSDECRNAIKEVKKTLENALRAEGSSERNLDNFIGRVCK
ncbi:hypothetical protein R3W88_022371 [Solanum pinnatisectum]|uniref:Uncharacterized protein n=1 Tax=Solanum pinnatisectum TaxID=50273 RepID=A0AAV9LUK0_9SOLN|nr:hypothetical protein R3W88_022371 [Solanum pinnatisectum]